MPKELQDLIDKIDTQWAPTDAARIDTQWLDAMRTWQEADEADGGYTPAGDQYAITAQSSQKVA